MPISLPIVLPSLATPPVPLTLLSPLPMSSPPTAILFLYPDRLPRCLPLHSPRPLPCTSFSPSTSGSTSTIVSASTLDLYVCLYPCLVLLLRPSLTSTPTLHLPPPPHSTPMSASTSACALCPLLLLFLCPCLLRCLRRYLLYLNLYIYLASTSFSTLGTPPHTFCPLGYDPAVVPRRIRYTSTSASTRN